METCSHLLEIRKVMDKCLVCDIQVQDITLSATGLQINTNKWLHLEDWLEIDTAIERLLKPYCHSETLEGFEMKNFHLGGAIRIDCRKTKVNKSHKRILGEDKTYLPVALDVQVTKINTVTLMEQITMFEEQLNKIKIKEEINLPPNNEVKQKEVDKECLREYDPTAHSDVIDQNSNDYVPYTASAKTPTSALDNSGSAVSEPYSPRPINNEVNSPGAEISESPNQISNYRPARIAHVKTSKETEPTDSYNNNNNNEKPKSSRRKHSPESKSSKSSRFKEPTSSTHVSKRTASQSTSKQTKNLELFGSDDSDLDLKNPTQLETSSKPSQSPNLNSSQSSDKDNKRKKIKLRHDTPISSSSHKGSLDGWLSKGSIKGGTEKEKSSNGKPSSKKSSRHESSSKRHAHPPSKDEKKDRDGGEAQPLKELAAIRDALKAKRKSPPSDIEILSLTHLSLQEILNTFDGIRPVLDPIFRNYSKKSKVTGYDGINHMKTIMLIDDKKQIQMLNFLRENYQPNEKGVPSLTDLYINAMVPEWTINVFMKEYKFTRLEAIERLQAQEDITVRQKKDEMLDIPDKI